ncbi:MAG: pyruvate ferredoxin oxidoreductase [Desulfuromonadaceae bacterium]|nr:pyruvate ferredoxin oxidoreductase [Desulfuromonadaceae bacterium]
MKKFITGNHAVAEAVRLCRPDVVAAYPITPQTPIYEQLADWDSAGELGGTMVKVESEHSAMATCLSASLTGVRTFTATSSQGLALMHEMLHFAAGSRTAVVMAVVNRSLAAPWAFWSDQTDSLSQRDTGWLQLYCEDNQEALDTTIQAFKIAEELMLPVMVMLEANFISHFMEPTEVPEPDQVDEWLLPVNIPRRFDLSNPGFMNGVVSAKQYRDFRRLASDAMEHALTVVERVDKEYESTFGRSYGLVETVDCADAELVLVTTATITSTARVALASLRSKGIKVGLCKLRLFRPFPVKALRDVLDNAPRVAVIERNISIGREGIFCSEIKSALINSPGRPKIQGYLAGIGGTDVNTQLIEWVVQDAITREVFVDQPIWVDDAVLEGEAQ